MFSGIMENDQWHEMRLNSEIGRSPQGLTTRKFQKIPLFSVSVKGFIKLY